MGNFEKLLHHASCPLSSSPLLEHTQVQAEGSSSWSAEGLGFLIGRKSGLAWAQVSAPRCGRVSRARRVSGGALKESSAGRWETGYLKFKGACHKGKRWRDEERD